MREFHTVSMGKSTAQALYSSLTKKPSQLTLKSFIEEGVTASFHFAVIRKGHLAQSLSPFAHEW
jgi:hypothetical protein